MGVCGYTYDQVSAMPIDALARAIRAKYKFERDPWNALFRAFSGSTENESPRVAAAERPMTRELFDAVFS